MRRPARLHLLLLLLPASACHQPEVTAPEVTAPDLTASEGKPSVQAPSAPPLKGITASRALISAAPDAWPKHLAKVRSQGETVVPALLEAIRETPLGAGVQAGLFALGEIGGETARLYLEGQLTSGTSLAQEAALALGSIRDARSIEPLRSLIDDPAAPVTSRAAAASALIDLGAGRSIAPFLSAVFLAATPYGRGTTRREGLPRTKTRWALERYMIIEALRRRYAGEDIGLDEDFSWPALRAGAAKLEAFLAKK